MKIKNTIISLSVTVVLTICMFNSVAAAPVNKQTTDVYSNYAVDVPNKEQPGLALMLSDNVTSVNRSVEFIGLLATGTQSALHPIEGATVNIQQLNTNGSAWHTLGTVLTSSTGKEAGFFTGSYCPKIKGYHILRATYDGDSNYAPAVSNVVALIVN